jgi:DNA-binding response OmpR family regulator
MPKVLVITDSNWVINDVRAVLGIGHWDVEVLGDPHEVVPTIDEVVPDAVVIDLQIGSMGGMAVVREILSVMDQEERPRLVLLLDRTADSFLAKRAGADAWVVKPFEAHDLRVALEGVDSGALASDVGDVRGTKR